VNEKILVANADTHLGNQICQGLEQRGHEVYRTLGTKINKAQGEKGFFWEGHQLLSTKNLFHTLWNRLGKIQRLIVPLHPIPLKTSLLNSSMADLECWADLYFKGYLYLLKEGLRHAIEDRLDEILVLLLDEGAQDPMSSGAIEGISASLSVLTNENPSLLDHLKVYHGTMIDSEVFLERFWKEWEEADGNPRAKRWIKMSEKRGLSAPQKFFISHGLLLVSHSGSAAKESK
jgi:hypothetical protein